MKSFFSQVKKVFIFTARHRMITKGWKYVTFLIAFLCIAVPAASMSAVEFFSSKKQLSSFVLDDVYVNDLTGNAEFDFSIFNHFAEASGQEAFQSVRYHLCTDSVIDYDTTSDSSDCSLLLVFENEDGTLHVSVIPIASTDMDIADAYRDFINELIPLYIVARTGAPVEALTSLSSITYEYSLPEDDFSSDDTIVSNPSQSVNSEIKEILGFLLPYLNIMLLYFLILFYGQGTATCVILEKTSKLMDTLLISVKPQAMVVGKVLAQAFCCVVQIFLWVICIYAGFALGVKLVYLINPESTMDILSMLDASGILGNIFTPVHVLFFILYLAAGLLLYLSLSAIGGSLASKQDDLNMTNVIYVMVLLISFFATLSQDTLSGKLQTSATLLDWIPFTSILVAPSHLLIGSLTIVQSCLSLFIVFITSLLIMLLSGRIYKVMAMYKGNIPSVRKIFSMIFSGD